MGVPSNLPTVPVVPTRRSSRPHTTHLTRVPSSFDFSAAVTVPESYTTFINDGDIINHAFKVPTFTRSEVSDLLSAATAAWMATVDHIAQANAVTPLNVNPDGSPLSYKTATHGPDRPSWKDAEDAEFDRLLDTSTMHPIHLAQQSMDRRSDTTYYNPKQAKRKIRR